jgi:methylmalonyl-CoA mutase cobalamin-binding domain/chain
MEERPRFTIVAGGVMPDEDVIELQNMGVAAVLGQDSTPEKIVQTIMACAPVEASFE